MPFLNGKNPGVPHVQLCWCYRQGGALRQGDWKLLKDRKDWKLFNLAEDLEENHNLSTKNPKKLEAMKVEWLKLRKTMPDSK